MVLGEARAANPWVLFMVRMVWTTLQLLWFMVPRIWKKIPVIFYEQIIVWMVWTTAPAALVHGSKDLEKILVIFYAQNDGSYGLNHSPADLVHGKTSKSFLQIFCHDATNLFTVYCTVYISLHQCECKTSVSASRRNFILAEFLIDHMELQKLINIKPLGIGFGTNMWVRAGGWGGRWEGLKGSFPTARKYPPYTGDLPFYQWRGKGEEISRKTEPISFKLCRTSIFVKTWSLTNWGFSQICYIKNFPVKSW